MSWPLCIYRMPRRAPSPPGMRPSPLPRPVAASAGAPGPPARRGCRASARRACRDTPCNLFPPSPALLSGASERTLLAATVPKVTSVRLSTLKSTSAAALALLQLRHALQGAAPHQVSAVVRQEVRLSVGGRTQPQRAPAAGHVRKVAAARWRQLVEVAKQQHVDARKRPRLPGHAALPLAGRRDHRPQPLLDLSLTQREKETIYSSKTFWQAIRDFLFFATVCQTSVSVMAKNAMLCSNIQIHHC